MAQENVVNQENFEMLLNWLDRNRDAAALKYEKIRVRLIRIFTGRGCFEAEALADETFDRVAAKMPQIAAIYTGEPALYCYGVADKLHYEWLRKQKKINQLPLPEIEPPADEPGGGRQDYECLEKCLAKLSVTERQMIVEYYREVKSAKIECRRLLAEKLGMTITALQVKTCRLRSRLKDCLQNCLAEKY